MVACWTMMKLRSIRFTPLRNSERSPGLCNLNCDNSDVRGDGRADPVEESGNGRGDSAGAAALEAVVSDMEEGLISCGGRMTVVADGRFKLPSRTARGQASDDFGVRHSHLTLFRSSIFLGRCLA